MSGEVLVWELGHGWPGAACCLADMGCVLLGLCHLGRGAVRLEMGPAQEEGTVK